MKKLFIFAIATLGMLACSPKNDPSNPTVEIKDGALPGKFSVSAHDMVQFSQGNLQYQPSTKTWRFAEYQYDTIGPNDINMSDTSNDWLAHFNWFMGGSHRLFVWWFSILPHFLRMGHTCNL